MMINPLCGLAMGLIVYHFYISPLKYPILHFFSYSLASIDVCNFILFSSLNIKGFVLFISNELRSHSIIFIVIYRSRIIIICTLFVVVFFNFYKIQIEIIRNKLLKFCCVCVYIAYAVCLLRLKLGGVWYSI